MSVIKVHPVEVLGTREERADRDKAVGWVVLGVSAALTGTAVLLVLTSVINWVAFVCLFVLGLCGVVIGGSMVLAGRCQHVATQDPSLFRLARPPLDLRNAAPGRRPKAPRRPHRGTDQRHLANNLHSTRFNSPPHARCVKATN